MNLITEPTLKETLTIQSWLSPALIPVLANRDYERRVEDLHKLDADLVQSGIEQRTMPMALETLPP